VGGGGGGAALLRIPESSGNLSKRETREKDKSEPSYSDRIFRQAIDSSKWIGDEGPLISGAEDKQATFGGNGSGEGGDPQ